jgi:ribosome-associated toxin RatA of RatAB toxin-antitoxin module
MKIHFNDTQSANAPAEALFDTITDYANYPNFNSHVVTMDLISHDDERAEFRAGRNTTVEKNTRAFDHYSRRNGDLVIDRTYGAETGQDARSTWTIHAVDADHSTLNIDASMTMPWWKGIVMKPFLRKVFYSINFTPFITEAEKRAAASKGTSRRRV